LWYSSLLSGHDSHFSFRIVDLTKSSPSLEREFKIHPHNSNNIIAKLASSILGVGSDGAGLAEPGLANLVDLALLLWTSWSE